MQKETILNILRPAHPSINRGPNNEIISNLSLTVDMARIYQEIIKNPRIGAVLVLSQMPTAEMGDLCALDLNGNPVVLLKEDDDMDTMLSRLRDFDGQYKHFEIEERYLVLNPTPKNRINLLYSEAVRISEILDIPCPQILSIKNIFFSGWEQGAAKHTRSSLPTSRGLSLGNLVFLKAAGRKTQTFFLAHELRHCWQNLYFHEKLLPLQLNPGDYLTRPEEIDANAFACLYMEMYWKISEPVFTLLGKYVGRVAMEKSPLYPPLLKRIEEIRKTSLFTKESVG